MKIKNIMNAVTSKFGRQTLIAQKHSPAILFAAGVVGIAATVVMASRATLKLEEILETAEDRKIAADAVLARNVPEYTSNDYRKDMAITRAKMILDLTKLYGPSVLVGLTSIAALTGSHVVLNRRYLAVTAAYAAVEKGFEQYRRRVVDELGLDKDKEFRYGLVDKEIVDEDEHGSVVKTVKGLANKDVSIYARFFDEHAKSWSREWGYNQIFLRCQQNYANDLLRARGHVFLNEIYDMLGLSRTQEGSVVGWLLKDGGDGFVDFGIFDGDIFNGQRFVNGDERSILLDFNVDGVIWDKI